MKRNLHHATAKSALAPQNGTGHKHPKLKRHRPPTKKQLKAGLEICRMMGIDPYAIPEERVREISKIWE